MHEAIRAVNVDQLLVVSELKVSLFVSSVLPEVGEAGAGPSQALQR